MTDSPLHRIRCSWCTQDPIYLSYHDLEWGKPIFNEQELFELLCLEGQQAGLSWLTVLKKRACYRTHFFQYPIEYIATFTDQDIAEKCTDQGLIRHLGKLTAIRDNAIAWQKLKSIHPNVSAWIWSFAKPSAQGHYQPITQSLHSQQLSKALKTYGFKFVGPTICYAFMQAAGLVNDHEEKCWLSPTLTHRQLN